MKILYLTSFNQELYKASGKSLINSKRDLSIDGDIFIGYEGFEYIGDANREIWYNLDQDTFLQKWLENNKDIIPEYLGGLAKPCNCSKDPYDRHDRAHKKGCHFTWWNRNCSRWFRKIACLNQILDDRKYQKFSSWDYFIWLDADCIFRETISEEVWLDVFKDADVSYMRGKKRRAVESGIFGIKNNEYGLKFIKVFIDYYTTGQFLNYERWDDGFIFKYILEDACPKSIDICSKANTSEVAEVSPLTRYIKHFKGRHGKGLEIMK